MFVWPLKLLNHFRSGEFKHIDSLKQHVGGDPRVYRAGVSIDSRFV